MGGFHFPDTLPRRTPTAEITVARAEDKRSGPEGLQMCVLHGHYRGTGMLVTVELVMGCLQRHIL